MKFKLGQKVKVLDSRNSILINGDVGIITEYDTYTGGYRVTVENKDNFGNWIREGDMELVPQTGEETQEYLKSIGMEDQMLRQLMMTMPMRDVSWYYGERVLLEKEKVN